MPRYILPPPTATVRVAGSSAKTLLQHLVLPASKHAPAPAASVLRHVALESLRRYYLPINDPEHLSLVLYTRNGRERGRTIFNPFTLTRHELELSALTAPTRAQFGQTCFRQALSAALHSYLSRVSGASLCQMLAIPFYGGVPSDVRNHNPYDMPSWATDLIREQGDAMNAGHTPDTKLFTFPVFARAREFLLRPTHQRVVRYQRGRQDQFPLVETTTVVIPQAVPRYVIRLMDPLPLTVWEQQYTPLDDSGVPVKGYKGDPSGDGTSIHVPALDGVICPPTRATVLIRFTPSVGLPSLEAFLHVVYSPTAGFRLARERLRDDQPNAPATLARGLVPASLSPALVLPEGSDIDHNLVDSLSASVS